MSNDLEVRRSKFRAAWNKIVSRDHIATNIAWHTVVGAKTTKNTRLKWTSLCGVWCNVFFVLFFFLIHKWGESMLTILKTWLFQLSLTDPDSSHSRFKRLISQQASNPVSCAVSFLNVCPFLHLHRHDVFCGSILLF